MAKIGEARGDRNTLTLTARELNTALTQFSIKS